MIQSATGWINWPLVASAGETRFSLLALLSCWRAAWVEVFFVTVIVCSSSAPLSSVTAERMAASSRLPSLRNASSLHHDDDPQALFGQWAEPMRGSLDQDGK